MATEEQVRVLHDALGGNGWAYTYWDANELVTCRDKLESGVDAVLAIAQPKPTIDAEVLRAFAESLDFSFSLWAVRGMLMRAADLIDALAKQTFPPTHFMTVSEPPDEGE